MPWSAILGFATGNWKWLLGGLVAIVLAIAVWAHFKHVSNLETQVLTLQTDLSTATKANADMKADYSKSLAQKESAYNQALRDKDESAKEAAKLKEVLDAINASPPGSDGPIAPVLGDALNRLYP